jgi:putative ATP-binding cassette transporter
MKYRPGTVGRRRRHLERASTIWDLQVDNAGASLSAREFTQVTNNPESELWGFNPDPVQQVRSLFSALTGSPGRKKLILLAVGLLVVIGATVVAQLRLNAWNKPFFDAIEHKDIGAFGMQLLIFAIIAGSLLILNVAQTWLDQTTKVEMRQWVTRDLFAQWMLPKRAFLIGGAGKIGVNPDQRIHEDCRQLTELSTALAIGFLQSTLLLLSFVGVLWVLSQGFVIKILGHSLTIPGFMVWAALIYATSGSLFSWLVGRPLIKMRVERYAREADLRFALVRVNESADGIALDNGEQEERQHLEHQLDDVITVMRRIVSGLVRLRWVTSGYGWFAIIAPILIAAPGYFSGQLTFGELMMTVGAFNQVQQASSWFANNASDIADWRATLQRVMSFRAALFAVDRLEQPRSRVDVVADSESLVFDNVVVSTNGREISLENQIVEIRPGERVLFIGKPGIGKSMFFRAIAGLWPWGTGRLRVPPQAHTMFLPQRFHTALGSLREALAYPAAPGNFSEADLARALTRTNLGHLIPSLERKARWDKELTADELLHLHFARLLVHKPQWVVSDEAICHLNEDDRKIMFSLFENELSKAAVVSITSIDAQHTFYSRILHLIARPTRRKPTPPSTSALLASPDAERT